MLQQMLGWFQISRASHLVPFMQNIVAVNHHAVGVAICLEYAIPLIYSGSENEIFPQPVSRQDGAVHNGELKFGRRITVGVAQDPGVGSSPGNRH